MYKKVIWIDDDTNAMKEIVSNNFIPLWENDVISQIYIFGDAVRDIDTLDKYKDNEKLAISDLNFAIFDRFVSFIIDKNIIDDEQKIQDNLKKVYMSSYNDIKENSECDVALSKSDVFLDNTECIEDWRKLRFDNNEDDDSNFVKLYKESVEKLTEGTEYLLKSLIDDNEENIAVALDLCLLKDDYYKMCFESKEFVVNTTQGKEGSETQPYMAPILSMGLYNQLKNKQFCGVFLYSSFCIPDKGIRAWKNTYKKIYDSSEDIIIYKRDGENSFDNEGDYLYVKISQCLEKEEV